MVIDFPNILASFSVIIAAVAIILGVSAWQREYVGKRKIELAEEVLALFYEARDAISYIRNIFGFVGEGKTRKADPNESPEDKKLYDDAYVVFERYNKHQELFNKLYSMRYRYMARFGKDSAKPFIELQRIVNEIFSAASQLPDYQKQQGSHYWQNKAQFEQHLKEMRELEAIVREWGSASDLIKPRIDAVISDIEAQTLIIVQGISIWQQIKHWFLRPKHKTEPAKN